MSIYTHPLYQEDLSSLSFLNIPWEKLQNKNLLISGATGLIGCCLIDVIMHLNYQGLNCKIYALGRDKQKAIARLGHYEAHNLLQFISHDITKPLPHATWGNIDYIIHLASNTHPILYATDPIGTITTNIIGTLNMLEFTSQQKNARCLFASSNEIYGENRGDTEKFDELYCGYINPNTVRAGYPESKRCGESLCQAYITQKNIDVVIPRLTRSYGPTMLLSDSKAISQFIKNALQKEDIVLKSQGLQYYSYTYVTDAVAGLLTVLLKGNSGEVYNVADDTSDIRLCDLASMIANLAGTTVIYNKPDTTESAGYSTATKARLDGSKLHTKLGWKAKYNIQQGIERTIKILQEFQCYTHPKL
ncbi:NAD-dependent epimerase/dehydratase family protein [Pelistega europaea]|uniref:NAD-dependent epimerase/dehydratase family protein n=1 Tax=Pelistega europaea TaxID=106147 RepID=A0A7Y4LCH2_9BURK|nr:NAD-dependent epimerase/dehydratase family protein [Pelistega europaea]NOL49912.1 NAD-dependent epimerase/dehydratase family protein [Pelistega europaea]